MFNRITCKHYKCFQHFFPLGLYSKNYMLQVGNCFSSYLSYVPFMLHNSLFSLVTTPFKAIYLLFNPLLILIKKILGVVLFLPELIYAHFVIQRPFSHLVCFLLL
jgi:hypothetical protein